VTAVREARFLPVLSMAMIIALVARVFDLFDPLRGFPVVKVLTVTVALAFLAAPRRSRPAFARSSVARTFLWFVALACVSVVFSDWRGGSFGVVTGAISASSEFTNFQIGFTEPALFDRDLLAGFLLYNNETNFDEQSFQTASFGFEPRIGFPVSENGRLTLRYEISSTDIYDTLDDTSLIIVDDLGLARSFHSDSRQSLKNEHFNGEALCASSYFRSWGDGQANRIHTSLSPSPQT